MLWHESVQYGSDEVFANHPNIWVFITKLQAEKLQKL
jgi:hypothetical protein